MPRDVLARLKPGQGDTLHVTGTPDGIALTPCDPAIAKQVELGRAFMQEYSDTFHALAK